jgi:hypothetical protein
LPRISNKDLQAIFKIYNERFFDGQISEDYLVKFEPMREDDGLHIPGAMEILINSDLKRHPDLATFILLHEMAHASLPDYVGHANDGHHGMRFQAKLNELYQKGAYDGLL